MRQPLLTLALAWAATALAGEGLVRNPSFEADADGAPDAWQAAGDRQLVAQTLTLDRGRDGKRCAKLACTRFQAANPACHAMLAQMGVAVTRGKAYRVRLWAKARAIGGEMVSIALSDTAVWADCGLSDGFAPGPAWQAFDFLFRAKRTVGAESRFQIWFASTGTLWVDDITFEEAGPDAVRPGHVLAAEGRVNLVPNASFECGAAGWGSAEWDRTTHWGGRMNALWGAVDDGVAFHGRRSLRIDVSAEHQPVSYFDYFDLYRVPVWAPLAASIGYIEVEPGKPYTLSVVARAAAAGTPARLAVREFQGPSHDKGVRVGTVWQRYALTFKPSKRWCYVLAGPDLRKSDERPFPPRSASLWLDAVQLQQGGEPTAFVTRDPVELAVATGRAGNVLGWDDKLAFRITVANSDPAQAVAPQIELRLTDFLGKDLWQVALATSVPPASAASQQVAVGQQADQRGFLRLHTRLRLHGAVVAERTQRLAVIPPHEATDSRFGVNHAYPWPHLLDRCRQAGLLWVRDWSLKWKDVEPEKGRFTFAETDHQIDRPRRHGLHVLAMLPFPSAPWSSTAPAELREKGDYLSRRQVVAYAPRDAAEFERYVERTVARYKGRVRWWQVFNEPVFTTYALPRKFGYTGKDYATWTQAFVRAARRADPECKILAGIGYLRAGQIADDFEQFFAAGGHKGIDAIDVHHYPRLRSPEFVEALLEGLNAQMERHGGRKPIWLTEYGYYADDDPWAIPMPHGQFNRPLRSEALQCAYAVRWATLCLANGVDKIFYHAGTCDGVNADSLQGIFFEYDGQPHQIYAAQAVMSHLLTTGCRFVRKLPLGEGVRACLFRDAARCLAVVWAPRDAKPQTVRLANDKLELWDLMGRPQKARAFTPDGTPVYVVADGLTAEAFAAGLR